MPPKKKGKKSAKKKKSGKKSNPNAPFTEMSELSKEYFLIQIRDLEDRLARYQRKCDELEIGNQGFQSQYDQQVNDKKEIVSFLKKQLEQRGEELADLQDRLIGLQQAKDAEKDQYEVQLATIRTEMQEVKDQLTSENMVLGGKLASLEEFKVQKDDLMAKFAKLESELEANKQEHKDVIYNLERKAVVDKDRLKKEMILRVNQVAAEFRKVSNKQMAETTKRTIRENVSINSQLSKMSDKTMELIQDNDELRAKEKQMKRQIEMLEYNEKEMAKKNSSNQKIIRMLAAKAKQQEDVILEFEETKKEYKNLEDEIALYRKQAESVKEELKKSTTKNEDYVIELEKVKKDREVAMKQKDALVKTLSEAASALESSLKIKKDSDGILAAEELKEKLAAEREGLLQILLEILNSAAEFGVGPHATNFRPKSAPYSGLDLGKHIRRKRASAVPAGLYPSSRPQPHYKLGDLGFVPRSKPKLVPLHWKATGLGADATGTRSIGTQTFSSQKAMFFADQLLTSDSKHGGKTIIHDYRTAVKTDLSTPQGKVR